MVASRPWLPFDAIVVAVLLGLLAAFLVVRRGKSSAAVGAILGVLAGSAGAWAWANEYAEVAGFIIWGCLLGAGAGWIAGRRRFE